MHGLREHATRFFQNAGQSPSKIARSANFLMRKRKRADTGGRPKKPGRPPGVKNGDGIRRKPYNLSFCSARLCACTRLASVWADKKATNGQCLVDYLNFNCNLIPDNYPISKKVKTSASCFWTTRRKLLSTTPCRSR